MYLHEPITQPKSWIDQVKTLPPNQTRRVESLEMTTKINILFLLPFFFFLMVENLDQVKQPKGQCISQILTGTAESKSTLQKNHYLL